jgi:hypothetical protein
MMLPAAAAAAAAAASWGLFFAVFTALYNLALLQDAG